MHDGIIMPILVVNFHSYSVLVNILGFRADVVLIIFLLAMSLDHAKQCLYFLVLYNLRTKSHYFRERVIEYISIILLWL